MTSTFIILRFDFRVTGVYWPLSTRAGSHPLTLPGSGPRWLIFLYSPMTSGSRGSSQFDASTSSPVRGEGSPPMSFLNS